MAETKNGILSSIKGKIGPVVGVQWRDKNILRTKPTKSKKVPSLKQQIQRDKLTLASQFITPYKRAINNCCTSKIGTRTAVEVALSHLLKQAIVVDSNRLSIQYNKVLFTLGYLPIAEHMRITSRNNSEIIVQWTNNSANGITAEDDTLTMLLYDETKGLHYTLEDCALRKDTLLEIDFPHLKESREIHIWAIWTNSDKSLTSTSIYLGAI